MWPFRKEPEPQPPEQWPPINEDWRAGDMAQCLNGDWGLHVGPLQRDIVLVRSVVKGWRRHDGKPDWGLEIEGYPESHYIASAFRKLRPCGDALDRRATKTRGKQREKAR